MSNLAPEPKKSSCLGDIVIGVLIAGSLLIAFVVIIAIFRPKTTTAIVIEKSRPAWINGIETCKTSKEYGQLVAPDIGFYVSTEVNPATRMALIPHGTKVEVFDFADGMQYIRYNGTMGYVQSVFVVNYDPATGVKPSTVGCL